MTLTPNPNPGPKPTPEQVLMCIALNFSRSRLKQLKQELETSEQLRAEEHADKVRLLRYNGVQL